MADIILLSNPMTTQDDIIVGGASGAAGRLAKGSDGQVLTVDPSTHHLVWATPSSGFSDPMTTRGDIIVRNASNTTTRLPIGSSGKVLSSDGTDVSWQTPSGGSGALVLLEQHTASASATLDFTAFISSTYDDYLFEFLDVVPATTNVAAHLRVGTGAGPTYTTGSTAYKWASWRNSNTGAIQSGSGGGSEFGLDGAGGVINTAGVGIWGSAKLSGVQSGNGPKITGQFGYVDNSGGPLQCTIAGQWANATVVTAVRFLFSSGNVSTGTIRVYGIAK